MMSKLYSQGDVELASELAETFEENIMDATENNVDSVEHNAHTEENVFDDIVGNDNVFSKQG